MSVRKICTVGEDWGSVVEAVRTFVNIDVDAPELLTRAKAQKSNETALSRIADNIRKIETIISECTTNQDSDHIRYNNSQLSHILHILQSSLPQSLNELILVAEEERIHREELQAEIEVLRIKQRSQLSKFQEISSYDSMRSENGCASPLNIPEIAHLRRKLAEAEAEIEQLKHIIRTFQSK